MFVSNTPQHNRGLFLISNHEKVIARTEAARLRYPPYEAADLVQVKSDQDYSWRDAWVINRVADGEKRKNGRTEVFPQYEIVYSKADVLEPVEAEKPAEPGVAENPVIVAGYDMRERFWRDFILEKLKKDPKKPHFVTFKEEDALFERTISIYDAYEKRKINEKSKSKKNPKKRKASKSKKKEPAKKPKKPAKKSKKKTVGEKIPVGDECAIAHRTRPCWYKVVGEEEWQKSEGFIHFLEAVKQGTVKLPFEVLPTKHFKRSPGLKIYCSNTGKLGPNGLAYLKNLSEGVEYLDIRYAGYTSWTIPKGADKGASVAENPEKPKNAKETVVAEKNKNNAKNAEETAVAEATVAEKTEADKTKPEADKTEEDKTEEDKPEADKPETDKPEADKPEADASVAENSVAENSVAENSVAEKKKNSPARGCWC